MTLTTKIAADPLKRHYALLDMAARLRAATLTGSATEQAFVLDDIFNTLVSQGLDRERDCLRTLRLALAVQRQCMKTLDLALNTKNTPNELKDIKKPSPANGIRPRNNVLLFVSPAVSYKNTADFYKQNEHFSIQAPFVVWNTS